MSSEPDVPKPDLPTPKTGLAGLKAHFKEDFISGLMISLIALPLCLGIASAAGLPPISGLFTAIIGGLFASRIAGAHVIISGPAAGLIVVNLGAVAGLGGFDPDPACVQAQAVAAEGVRVACAYYAAGYPHALGSMFVAGIVIMAFGIFKAGKLGDFFPSAVIHGMLAGIGVIIMVKQFFVAVGSKDLTMAAMKSWKEAGGSHHGLIADFVHIPFSIANLSPYVTITALVAVSIIIIHPFIKIGLIKKIPAAMWVICATIPLGRFLKLHESGSYTFMGKTYEMHPVEFLVQLPPNIMDGVVFPKFDKIATPEFWIAGVMTIALVTTIESMLSEVAVDSLDPYKRRTNLNKGLFSNGAGATAGACIGAIPMISEIVRSSANVTNGAMTQWSNFWHAAFLLLFLLVGKPVIDMIPNAALAGILICVGFKLAAPKEFAHVLEIGKAQLFLFTLTMVTVLCTDLLIGVATGIIAKLIIHLYYGTPVLNAFKPEIECSTSGDSELIKLKDSAIFSNYLGIKGYILKLDKDKAKNITLDFNEVKLVDHSVMAALDKLKSLLAESGQTLHMINMDHLTPVTEHPLAARIGI